MPRTASGALQEEVLVGTRQGQNFRQWLNSRAGGIGQGMNRQRPYLAIGYNPCYRL